MFVLNSFGDVLSLPGFDFSDRIFMRSASFELKVAHAFHIHIRKICLMPLNLLGKILLPREQSWRQRQQAKNVFAALIVALIFASIIAAVMLMRNSHR